jgi:hypothetical protein
MKQSHLNKISSYYKENGLKRTINRMAEIFWQNIFQNKTIIFYVDLGNLNCDGIDLPANIIIERRREIDEISEL